MSPTVPFIPDTAPFSPEQRAWLNGFLAGAFSRAPAASSGAFAAPASDPLRPLTILWGSQTGTCETLAKQLAKTAGQRGFAPTIVEMSTATLDALATIENLLVVTSTYGDGEPPDNAQSLHAALHAPDARPLPPSLRFSVCALGDSNYTLFCQCGKDIDHALVKLGATRVSPLVECDVDYEAPFASWINQALAALGTSSGDSTKPAAPAETTGTPATTNFGRTNPFPAPVLTVRNLNGAGSSKQVNHVEFSLAGSGLVYEAGDALSVLPQNCPDLVSAVLTALDRDGEEAITVNDREVSLRTALTQTFDLGKPPPGLLTLLGVSPGPETLDVLDALNASKLARPAPLAFVGQLKKIAPRLYSISSSPRAHSDQVHLTVGAVRYHVGGRDRKGVCSTFLAERAITHGTVGVFVHRNQAFRPPADPNVPMIMVGPGTGIAPFRAFLADRAALDAKGRNWLFFGDQHAASDYLYESEISDWLSRGLLTRVDTAFSRDQAAKIYVQDRMRGAGAELWSWLEAGAHFYVCGDAKRMAKDVDAALHDIVQTHGQKSPDEAAAYLNALKSAKRYARDVY